MPRVFLKGKTGNISREEARAWITASFMVLEFHNLHPHGPHIHFSFKKKITVNGKNCDGEGNQYIGVANRELRRASVSNVEEPQKMFTTILHEVIHLCAEFPDGGVEACTTTLCSRIKKDVARIAAILVRGTYKRAAAIAHTKISYAPKDGPDFYNKDEDVPIVWVERYRDKRLRQNA